jgi:integrase
MLVLLTDRLCQHAKSAAVQSDFFDELARGLCLRVTRQGTKTWTFLYTADGKRVRITLGRYPHISLANARAKAIEARGQVEAGQSPGRGGGGMTVAMLVDGYVEKHVAPLRTAQAIERRLRKNILPVIGNLFIADLHRRDATRVIDTVLARDAPIEAARAFEDLRAMLRWAVARGDLDHNPLEGMEKLQGSKPRERTLSEDEIRTLWAALPTALSNSQTCQRIIKLCLATAQRLGEVAGMRREELDLKRRIWSLPGSRTKNGHPHAVPLNSAAQAVIEEALRPGAEFVFPSVEGPIISHTVSTTIARAQGRFGLPQWTAHDLRRTALTEMAKLGVAPIVLGHVANHRTTTKAGMTLSVYVQHAYEREKREALELWADRLEGIISGAAEVVPMRGAER